MSRARSLLLFPALLVGAGLVGCDRKQPISVYQAPKDPTPVVNSLIGPASPSVDALPRPAQGELTWTVPATWQTEPAGGQMRFASFLVNENPKVELTVIPLGPEAGDLLPNINRWQRQLHLPPSSAEQLGDVAHPQVINGLEATLVDLTGPANQSPRLRMLAAIVPHADRVWFFKLEGPESIVAAQKANFDAFIHSLNPGAAPENSDSAPMAEASTNTPSHPTPADASMPALPPQPAGGLKLVKYTADPAWKQIPGASGPRAVAFEIGSADKPAELVVTHFPEGGAGSFLDNVNRWRGQLGLDPVDHTDFKQMKDIPIGKDGAGMVIDIDNPANSQRITVAIGITGQELWFYKMSGNSSSVGAARPAFETFLKSVEFAPASETP